MPTKTGLPTRAEQRAEQERLHKRYSEAAERQREEQLNVAELVGVTITQTLCDYVRGLLPWWLPDRLVERIPNWVILVRHRVQAIARQDFTTYGYLFWDVFPGVEVKLTTPITEAAQLTGKYTMTVYRGRWEEPNLKRALRAQLSSLDIID